MNIKNWLLICWAVFLCWGWLQTSTVSIELDIIDERDILNIDVMIQNENYCYKFLKVLKTLQEVLNITYFLKFKRTSISLKKDSNNN